MKDFEILNVGCLEKIVPSKRPRLIENSGVCLRNEIYSYQIAIRNNKCELFTRFPRFEIESDLADLIRVRVEENVICQTPIRNEYDDYYLIRKPSVMPDILRDDGKLCLRIKEWSSLYVTVDGDKNPGTYPIKIRFFDGENKEIGNSVYTLKVLDEKLGEFDVDYTNWFHYDSIAAYYKLEPFSNRYNEIMWKFVKNAVEHKMNTLLVPHITPALDTAIGEERLTTQLSIIRKNDDEYSFDFDNLISFMKEARKIGIERFEMAHLFTQWGAASAPKIMAIVNGTNKKIFGWDTESTSKEYLSFLKLYLSKLSDRLKNEGFKKNEVFFHMSDEPSERHLERYMYLKNEITPYIGEYKICDALSSYKFFEKEAVDEPIVSTAHAIDFMDKNVKNIRVYHCCGEAVNHLSNRFISMPLLRTRIIGIQLYMCEAKGFLQWGYNFYNSAFSKRYINPYLINDADGSFQSGDSFIVYPRDDGGVYDSIRHEALLDGFQDYMVLKRLEEKMGREEVESILINHGFMKNYTDYPIDDTKFVEFRKEIYSLIERK